MSQPAREDRRAGFAGDSFDIEGGGEGAVDFAWAQGEVRFAEKGHGGSLPQFGFPLEAPQQESGAGADEGYNAVHIGGAGFGAQVVEGAVVDENVEGALDMAKVGEVVQDEVDIGQGVAGVGARLGQGGWGEVDSGYGEALARKVDRVGADAAAEVDGAAGRCELAGGDQADELGSSIADPWRVPKRYQRL